MCTQPALALSCLKRQIHQRCCWTEEGWTEERASEIGHSSLRGHLLGVGIYLSVVLPCL
jgi:hypothetical protein